MSYVIYNVDTTIILRAPARSWGCYVESYKTERAAKAALTRLEKKGKLGSNYIDGKKKFERIEVPYVRADFAIAEISDFRENIEKQVERVNLMSREKYMEPINTPACVSPASETYWCM